MSYQTARRVRDERAGEWVAIRLADGGTGYVDRRYARSAIGYRASFERTDGRWVLTVFIAGD